MRTVCLVLLLLLVHVVHVPAQSTDTRRHLESQRKEILQEIDETEKELIQIRTDKKITINQLKVLQDKANERQRLIDNINDEVRYIDGLIASYENQIAGLKKKLARYKMQYTQSLRYSYRTRNNFDFLAYVCASSDFNDAVRRTKYLKVMRAMRRQQADKIRVTHAELYHQLDLLNAEKANRGKLLADLNEQNKNLTNETNDASNAFKDMAGKEKELMKDLIEQRNSAKRLDNAIRNIIKQEMQHSEDAAAGRKLRRETDEDNEEEPVTRKPKPDEPPAIGKDELALARSFEQNKGRLGWPVEKGTISCHFGKYNIKNIEYFNNGIDIHTVTYGIIKAVFDGVVSSIINIDSKQIIIVQHGNYFTVYGNIMRPMALKGQKVITGQPLGLVGNNEDGFPTLNFQIWKSVGSKRETVVLNPEGWIGKTAR